MKNLADIIEQNRDFLDKTATETMKCYISRKPPNSPEDSLSIARVSYRQALAMLEVRENMLLPMMVEDVKIFKKQRREKKLNRQEAQNDK